MTQVAAVVVTCHPQGDFIGRLERLASQVHWLIVVDNNSMPSAISAMNAFVQGGSGRKLICLYANHGLAAGMNTGIAAAAELGVEWALLVDQAAVVDAGLVSELLLGIRQDGSSGDIAVVAANGIDSTGRPRVPLAKDGEHDVVSPARSAGASGSLVNINAWRDMQGYREDLFIDAMDHDFCFRARKRGWRILQCRRPLMHHPPDEATRQAKWLGLRLAIPQGDPIRSYYTTRNRLVMFKQHWWREPMWSLRQLLAIPRDVLLVTLHGKPRLRRLGVMIRGLWAGFWGNMKPYASLLMKEDIAR